MPPRGGSSLVYAIGSHRDFALPFHGDLDEDLSGRYKLRSHELRDGIAWNEVISLELKGSAICFTTLINLTSS